MRLWSFISVIMPKHYCDYCDTYLTHDSPPVRKTHCSGRKHKENVKFYYQKWMEDQAQSLIDATIEAYKKGIMKGGSAAIPPPGNIPGLPPRPTGPMMGPPSGPMMGPPGGPIMRPQMGPGGPMGGPFRTYGWTNGPRTNDGSRTRWSHASYDDDEARNAWNEYARTT